MSSFHADNLAFIKLRMHDFAEHEAKREVLKRMRRIARYMVDFIDSHFDKKSQQYPEYTANLHDATGVAIYDNGKLESYMPTKRATEPQKSPIDEDEWGSEELTNVIRQGLARFSKGLWLVMFSASSYAEKIEDIGGPTEEERGRNFFTALWEYLSIDIRKEFDGCIIAPLFGLSDSIPF